MEIDITFLIGVTGAGLTLFAFVMSQIGRWNSETFAYDIFNSLSGILLAVYAYLIVSWPFLLINIVWAAFSVKGVIEHLRQKS